MPDKGLKKKYREALRRSINRRNRERLRNQAPTIIANNCNGGVISHDLGLKSPDAHGEPVHTVSGLRALLRGAAALPGAP